ncbi:MAG TPA: hypothetical protein VN730_15425 [Steroidobacteraceae bacterium]|nr:hypothetical protein [Steroidobacteraceae bacterium]
MAQDKTSSRRAFLRGGAILAAPVAAVALPAVALADQGLQARIRRLEDEAAIRELHRAWLQRVNAGERAALPDATVRRIIWDHAGAPDNIEIAADGRSAVGSFDCAVEVEEPLPKDCTLGQMAHAQGHGSIRRAERRTLRAEYAKDSGTWKISRVDLTTPG